MPLIEELEASGKWLFRWRSYLPLVTLLLVLPSLAYFTYPFGEHWLDQVWEVLCLLLGFLGVVIRGIVAGYVPGGTSGRNTRAQAADTLNTTGMYSVVRNPLYLGNFVMGLAVSLFLRLWWLPLIYAPLFLLYYERIVFAEEMFLRKKFGQNYFAWASRTPAFWPRLSQWQRPELRFSWVTFIRREYQSAYGLVVALFGLEQLTEWVMEGGWHVDTMWIGIVGVSTAAYLVTRFLHKKTKVLHEEGR